MDAHLQPQVTTEDQLTRIKTERIISDVIDQQCQMTDPYFERVFEKKTKEMTSADLNSDEGLLLQAASYFSVAWRDLVMASAEHGDERDACVQHAVKEMGHAISHLKMAGYNIHCS